MRWLYVVTALSSCLVLTAAFPQVTEGTATDDDNKKDAVQDSPRVLKCGCSVQMEPSADKTETNRNKRDLGRFRVLKNFGKQDEEVPSLNGNLRDTNPDGLANNAKRQHSIVRVVSYNNENNDNLRAQDTAQPAIDLKQLMKHIQQKVDNKINNLDIQGINNAALEANNGEMAAGLNNDNIGRKVGQAGTNAAGQLSNVRENPQRVRNWDRAAGNNRMEGMDTEGNNRLAGQPKVYIFQQGAGSWDIGRGGGNNRLADQNNMNADQQGVGNWETGRGGGNNRLADQNNMDTDQQRVGNWARGAGNNRFGARTGGNHKKCGHHDSKDCGDQEINIIVQNDNANDILNYNDNFNYNTNNNENSWVALQDLVNEGSTSIEVSHSHCSSHSCSHYSSSSDSSSSDSSSSDSSSSDDLASYHVPLVPPVVPPVCAYPHQCGVNAYQQHPY